MPGHRASSRISVPAESRQQPDRLDTATESQEQPMKPAGVIPTLLQAFGILIVFVVVLVGGYWLLVGLWYLLR
jgi:hypothetical protein